MCSSDLGHMTIVVENVHEIPEFIRKKDEFGFEYINFGYDKKVPAYLADNPEVKEELIRGIQVEIARMSNPARIDLHRLRLLGLIAQPGAPAAAPVPAAAPALATA